MDEGARKGLEQKMKYWSEKDYQYEFAVTLGQSFNLAFQMIGDSPRKPSRDEVYDIFKMLLKAKLDPAFIQTFNEYYGEKAKNFEDTVGSSKEIPIVRIK